MEMESWVSVAQHFRLNTVGDIQNSEKVVVTSTAEANTDRIQRLFTNGEETQPESKCVVALETLIALSTFGLPRVTPFPLLLPPLESSAICGPLGHPDLFRCLGKNLGSGSTSEVFEWICCYRLSPDESQPAITGSCFQVYESIELGEHVAVKCFAYSKDCIGSFSGGAQPPNYPTKLTTGIKELMIGAQLTQGEGTGKNHVCLLLASWVDRRGLWLVYRLVPAAKGLDEILAPGSSNRSSFCGQPLKQAARMFKQFALALQYLASNDIVHRDGGLANWLLANADTPEQKVMLIDFGLSLCSAAPFSESDTASNLLEHVFDGDSRLSHAEVVGDVSDLDMKRLNPIDWCYAPGAAGPKFPPPPELRVLRKELPSSAGDALKEQGCELPYSAGYDVWVLGWTFMQIVLGERWEDWKNSDDPLAQHVQSFFFDKTRQVEVPWELSDQHPAWRLKILSSGADFFKESFLDGFLSLATDHILSKGLEVATPLQAAFIQPDGKLRAMLLKMIDFDSKKRELYLTSGSLLCDLQEIEEEVPL
jgi:serine/threonine protein kinase